MKYVHEIRMHGGANACQFNAKQLVYSKLSCLEVLEQRLMLNRENMLDDGAFYEELGVDGVRVTR